MLESNKVLWSKFLKILYNPLTDWIVFLVIIPSKLDREASTYSLDPLVQLFVIKITNQPITWQKLNEIDLLKFKLGIRMGKEGDLGDFECGIVAGARQSGQSIFETVSVL